MVESPNGWPLGVAARALLAQPPVVADVTDALLALQYLENTKAPHFCRRVHAIDEAVGRLLRGYQPRSATVLEQQFCEVLFLALFHGHSDSSYAEQEAFSLLLTVVGRVRRTSSVNQRRPGWRTLESLREIANAFRYQ